MIDRKTARNIRGTLLARALKHLSPDGRGGSLKAGSGSFGNCRQSLPRASLGFAVTF
jgi:hypothetical protein